MQRSAHGEQAFLHGVLGKLLVAEHAQRQPIRSLADAVVKLP